MQQPECKSQNAKALCGALEAWSLGNVRLGHNGGDVNSGWVDVRDPTLEVRCPRSRPTGRCVRPCAPRPSPRRRRLRWPRRSGTKHRAERMLENL